MIGIQHEDPTELISGAFPTTGMTYVKTIDAGTP